jgi:hypothetical protein
VWGLPDGFASLFVRAGLLLRICRSSEGKSLRFGDTIHSRLRATLSKCAKLFIRYPLSVGYVGDMQKPIGENQGSGFDPETPDGILADESCRIIWIFLHDVMADYETCGDGYIDRFISTRVLPDS